MKKNTEIGMIGFGRFGELIAGYLAEDFPVVVYNRSDKTREIKQAGGQPCTLEEAAGKQVVILSVPISGLKQVLMEIAPHLRPETVVADVSSVKVYPVQWMRQALPDSVYILPTHPMFGPDSAGASLLDRKIVVCKDRIKEEILDAVKAYLFSRGLVVIETTPEEHDRQIAVSLSLTHFIGRALDAYGAKELIIDTEGYKRLLNILGVVTHDTWQLFRDMHRYNPYAMEERHAFRDALEKVESLLNKPE